MNRIAITGVDGKIGRLLARDLSQDFEVLGLDRTFRKGALRRRQDTRRVGTNEKTFAGVDTVIDLAADANELTSWRTVQSMNIPATLGTFEAARRAGVRRVIFASSCHVMGLYERDEPYASICAGRYDALERGRIPLITSAFPIRPDGPYAVGKAAGEAAARHYADQYGMSFICLRLGAVYSDDRPGSSRGRAIMLTHADLIRLVRACIAAPEDVRFAILFGVSDNTWRFWDIDEARTLVGYQPTDDAHLIEIRGTAAGSSLTPDQPTAQPRPVTR
jgi:nucleoside-diphosphate-sugar epimerase